MSEGQYGGPVVEITRDISLRLRGCKHCDDLRVLFREKIAKIAHSFNQILGQATAIQKQSSSHLDDLILALGSLKKHANDCIMVVGDGELGEPPPPAKSFGMFPPKTVVAIPESTWEKVPSMKDVENLTKQKLDEVFESMIDEAVSPASKLSAKIIKSSAIPCLQCVDGLLIDLSQCDLCNGTGMVDPKLLKKKPKKNYDPMAKEVLCNWCGFSSKVIGGSLHACPKCKKLLT